MRGWQQLPWQRVEFFDLCGLSSSHPLDSWHASAIRRDWKARSVGASSIGSRSVRRLLPYAGHRFPTSRSQLPGQLASSCMRSCAGSGVSTAAAILLHRGDSRRIAYDVTGAAYRQGCCSLVYPAEQEEWRSLRFLRRARLSRYAYCRVADGLRPVACLASRSLWSCFRARGGPLATLAKWRIRVRSTSGRVMHGRSHELGS